MDNTAWRLLAKQLTDAGFGDVATPGLRAQMDKSDGQVEVPFQRWLDGDEVQGRLQLRKAERSDYYSLDGFEIGLRRAGHTDWLKQNFQQFAEPYTLQEAYNLLSRRPVYKQIGYGEGNTAEAWLKLDFDRKLENGNYARKYYHADDGFDLERVLGRYPIIELADAGPRKELIETLKRGDLAKVTMQDADDSRRKLYITPSIATKSLLVRDENGIRVSPEKLVKQVGERQPAPKRVKRLRPS